MALRSRCFDNSFPAGIANLSEMRKNMVKQMGFGSFLQPTYTQIHVEISMWLITNINVSYRHIDLTNGHNIN